MSVIHITLYSHATAPNGWKVTCVLNELGLDYETIYLNSASAVDEHKSSEYLKINPNGRIPALVDHKNNDYTVWESATCLLYLVDKYDKENRLTMSGQGPYFGQGFWFVYLHPEKVPSAITRYKDEARRILGVLESVLSKQEWLVAGNVTIADIAFVPWNDILDGLFGVNFDFAGEFPATAKWHAKAIGLPGVGAGIAEKARLKTAITANARLASVQE